MPMIKENFRYIKPENGQRLVENIDSVYTYLWGFMKERAEAELQYATHLSKWVEKHQRHTNQDLSKWVDFPEVNHILKYFLIEADNMAKLHYAVYTDVKAKDGPIEKLKKEIHITRGMPDGAVEQYQVLVDTYLHALETAANYRKMYYHSVEKHLDVKRRLERRKSKGAKASQAPEGQTLIKHLESRVLTTETEADVAKCKYEAFLNKESLGRETFIETANRYQRQIEEHENVKLRVMINEIVRYLYCLKDTDVEDDEGGDSPLTSACRDLEDLDVRMAMARWRKNNSINIMMPQCQDYQPHIKYVDDVFSTLSAGSGEAPDGEHEETSIGLSEKISTMADAQSPLNWFGENNKSSDRNRYYRTKYSKPALPNPKHGNAELPAYWGIDVGDNRTTAECSDDEDLDLETLHVDGMDFKDILNLPKADRDYWIGERSLNSGHFINTKEWRNRTGGFDIKEAWGLVQPKKKRRRPYLSNTTLVTLFENPGDECDEKNNIISSGPIYF